MNEPAEIWVSETERVFGRIESKYVEEVMIYWPTREMRNLGLVQKTKTGTGGFCHTLKGMTKQ